MKPDKLIVGLGNPGSKYRGTRHNAGYMVLAELAQTLSFTSPTRKFHGEIVETRAAGKNLLLLSPTTYMNNSGQSVSEAVRFYKLELTDLLVICDDVDLPVGRIRFRDSGGSGGQKGVKDIISRLGSEKFSRLRVGVGRPPEGVDTADYVLSEFRSAEKPEIHESIRRAAEAALCWVEFGPDETANRFNGGSRKDGTK
ncbi:MAG: aminoacyl-tRNA hydrolase [Thermoguttaceae bacterium]|nr:aminoacyl-tRNA hydrolase [Thermoguttaceae bacterium]